MYGFRAFFRLSKTHFLTRKQSVAALSKKFYCSMAASNHIDQKTSTTTEKSTTNLKDSNIFLVDEDEMAEREEDETFGDKNVDENSTMDKSKFNSGFYDLLKILALDKKFDKEKHSANILLDGVLALTKLHDRGRGSQFVDFYPIWWKVFVENLPHYDGQSLCSLVETLGTINVMTRSSFRRLANLDVLELLVTRILSDDFQKLSPKAVDSLYKGLSSFSIKPTLEIQNQVGQQKENFPMKQLIGCTVEWIKIHEQIEAEFYDVGLSCIKIAKTLALIEHPFVDPIDEELLRVVLDVSKTMFDLNSRLSVQLAQSVNMTKIVRGQTSFVKTLLDLSKILIIAEHVKSDDVWRPWFAGAKTLMQIYKDSPTLLGNFNTDVNRRTSTIVCNLCASALETAFTLGKLDMFGEMKSIWSEMLLISLKNSDKRSFFHVTSMLRTVENSPDGRELIDLINSTDSGAAATENINSATLWDYITKRFLRTIDFSTQIEMEKMVDSAAGLRGRRRPPFGSRDDRPPMSSRRSKSFVAREVDESMYDDERENRRYTLNDLNTITRGKLQQQRDMAKNRLAGRRSSDDDFDDGEFDLDEAPVGGGRARRDEFRSGSARGGKFQQSRDVARNRPGRRSRDEFDDEDFDLDAAPRPKRDEFRSLREPRVGGRWSSSRRNVDEEFDDEEFDLDEAPRGGGRAAGGAKRDEFRSFKEPRTRRGAPSARSRDDDFDDEDFDLDETPLGGGRVKRDEFRSPREPRMGGRRSFRRNVDDDFN